jgi:hypothetical protein
VGVYLPDSLGDKAVAFPEFSYGTNRVTLVLADGRRVPDAYLAWGREIVKIGTLTVEAADDLDFHAVDVLDVVPEA